MKKILFLTALVAAVSGLQAQNTRSNAIKLNPLSLAFATGNVSYERKIAANQSLQLGAFYSGVSIGGLKYSGWGVTPEYRIYFAGAKEALNGVYVGPFVRYQSFNLTDKETSTETSYTSMGGGAILGWQKAWNSGFVLDLFAGPSYNSGKFKNASDADQFTLKGGINGFGVRTGLTLGFAF